jgi:hypothetical protein
MQACLIGGPPANCPLPIRFQPRAVPCAAANGNTTRARRQCRGGEDAAVIAVGAAMKPLLRDLYVSSVLGLYVEMPDTPPRANEQDRERARHLFAGQVSLEIVETALVLASVRRLMRPPKAPSLPRVRSLAYFQPVIEELLQQPPGHGYLGYLRRKLAACTGQLARQPEAGS